MIVTYGDHAHPSGECWFRFEYRWKHNRLGLRQTQINRAIIWGTIVQQDADQSALLTKIAALENAYSVDGRDLIVYLNDGSTQSRHFLLNAGTLNGVQVKELTWLDVDPRWRQSGTEHVNRRTFRIVLESEKIDPNASAFVAWEETIIGTGTGGAEFVMKPALSGPPQKQFIQQQTSFQAVQTGRAIGLLGYPIPATPIWPSDEHPSQRRVRVGTPKFGPVANTEFPIEWEYHFESTSALVGSPTFF